MNEFLQQFHFLRPYWFWALLPLAGLFWLLLKQQLQSRSWQQVIDPALMPYLLTDSKKEKSLWSPIAFLISGLLLVTALAGPVWTQLEQPVFREQSALVVILDLSWSMHASDIKPSRLERARLKLRDILDRRKEGNTALIVYAGTSFVVTPLTEDTHTITSQLSGLDSELMPSQGSRADRALAQAIKLLQQAAVHQGSILLITDGIDAVDNPELDQQLKLLRKQGHQLLILGVGSQQGAPIPQTGGGFLKDAQGSIVIPVMNPGQLTRISQQGNGIFSEITANDSDINRLLVAIDNHQQPQQEQQAESIKSDQWQEQGPWLLLPVILLSLLIFRRGYLVILIVAGIAQPQPAQAIDWDQLWLREDQQAQRLLDAGQPEQAAQQFQNPQWRASAYYKAKDYEASLEALKGLDSAEDLYNRGNALAQLERLPEAIQAYDEALKKQPEMPDALYNRELLKKQMQQQEEQKKQGKKDKQDAGEGSDEQSGEQQDSDQERQPDGDKPVQKDQNKRSESSDNQKDNESEPDQTQQESDQSSEEDSEQKERRQENKLTETSSEHDESKQATEQWLRRIPDDPAGLWRRKFLYQYQQQKQQGDEKRSW
ncbi:MAG: VWA domain-containing protein [Gammaproteobacteria bacterium]|nr:VWA domain-containing protein [Gammaproteobacteria bacterium]